MIIGILKDIKEGENRVIATPGEVATLIGDGNVVKVQKGAGARAGFEDEAYAAAGATLVDTAEEIYGTCEFVAKVKEFEPSEYGMLREGLIVFTCIHPAAHPEEVQVLLDKKVTAFTAEDSHRYGSPNCEAAGKQGALFGLESMLTINGGKGKFVSGLGGAPGMKVLILGGGVGNLIDRVLNGVVVDYINVLFMHFAIFNFADICVCVGVGLLMLVVLLDSFKKEETAKQKADDDGTA